MSKRGVFIRTRSWPQANESTYQALQAQFPDTPIDLIEIYKLLRRRRDVLVTNMLFVIQDYGVDILKKKRSLKDSFFRTVYIFKAIKRLINEAVTPEHYSFSFQMQALFDASRPGVPHFMYTDHTHLANLSYETFDRSKLYKPAWIDLERSIYHQATRVFTRSTNIARSVSEQYGVNPEKVEVVYAGSNTGLSNLPHNPDKYHSRTILFVGIDWARKGGPELVEAFRRVLTHYPDARLRIVGCSPQIDCPNCEVIGRVPLEQVNAHYEQAAIFCLPTRLEPFGIVFVEAMSQRLPLVATTVGAIPDMIEDGHNGFMVPPGNVERLTEALLALIGDPARCQAFGEHSYNLVLDRYNWNRVADRMKSQIEAATSSIR